MAMSVHYHPQHVNTTVKYLSRALNGNVQAVGGGPKPTTFDT